MLKSFFAATTSGGLYRISTEDDSSVVKKVYQHPDSDSKTSVGTELSPGPQIGISKGRGIITYLAEHSDGKCCSAYMTNVGRWAGNTSPIVGLFLKEEVARDATSRELPTRLAWDWSYMPETLRVLESIGTDHPHIKIDEPVMEMVDRAKAAALSVQRS